MLLGDQEKSASACWKRISCTTCANQIQTLLTWLLEFSKTRFSWGKAIKKPKPTLRQPANDVLRQPETVSFFSGRLKIKQTGESFPALRIRCELSDSTNCPLRGRRESALLSFEQTVKNQG